MRSFLRVTIIFAILFGAKCSEIENVLSSVEIKELTFRNPRFLGLLALLSGGVYVNHGGMQLNPVSLKYLSEASEMHTKSNTKLKIPKYSPQQNVVYTLIYPPNRNVRNPETTTEASLFRADPFANLNWENRSKRDADIELPKNEEKRQAADGENNGSNGDKGGVENKDNENNDADQDDDTEDPDSATTIAPPTTTEGTRLPEIPPWSFVPPSILPQPYIPPSPACTCSSFYYRPPQSQRPFHKPFLPLSPDAFQYDSPHGVDSNFQSFDRFPSSFNNLNNYYSSGSAFRPSFPDFSQDRWRSQRQIFYPNTVKSAQQKN